MNQILSPLDLEMANILHKEMIENGVNLRLSTGVTVFRKIRTEALRFPSPTGQKQPAIW
jgi:NADPH-dependent 2,4-dienoyl-CoA reductase/sulfur reductase-like enzyme